MEHHVLPNALLVLMEPMASVQLAIALVELVQPKELASPVSVDLFKMDQLVFQPALMANSATMVNAQAAHLLVEDAIHSLAANYVLQDISLMVDVSLNAQSDTMETLAMFAVLVTQPV